MSSGFKNFFITFVICLLVFGFVGFKYVYPALSDILNVEKVINPGETSGGDRSGDESDVSSEESSRPQSDTSYNENGRIFTLSVACVDKRGRAVAAAFVDSNEKTGQFILCSVPVTVRVVNEAGISVPLSDIMPSLSDSGMCSAFSAMTGLNVDYCIRFTRDDIIQLGKIVPGTFIKLSEDISFMDPKYKDFEPEPGEPYPDDYFVTISSKGGKVYLNEKLNGKTNLEWLLEYNPNSDEDTEYNAYYAAAAKAIFQQFFESEGALKNTGTLTAIIRGKQTNLNADVISINLDLIFGGEDFRRSTITYPGNWERAVETLRKLDGRKE